MRQTTLRLVAASAALATTILTTSALPTMALAQERVVHVYNWSDYIDESILEDFTKETGIKEIEHAPWVVFGKSSRGEFPFRAAWVFPDRVIASVTYHGETPRWPVAPCCWCSRRC